MISLGAQRWWAGFFAVTAIGVSLAGLLFGVGLLVVPASMVAPPPGDAVAGWAWGAPAFTLAFSAVTLVQVVRGRPLLWASWLRSERFNLRGRKRYELVIAFTAVSAVGLLALVGTVRLAAYAPGPRERAPAWETAALIFALEAVMLGTVGFVLFHGWWKRRGRDLALAPSRECPECGYTLDGVMGGTACPECGWGPRGDAQGRLTGTWCC